MPVMPDAVGGATSIAETGISMPKMEIPAPKLDVASGIDKIADTKGMAHAGVESIAKVDLSNPDVKLPQLNGSELIPTSPESSTANGATETVPFPTQTAVTEGGTKMPEGNSLNQPLSGDQKSEVVQQAGDSNTDTIATAKPSNAETDYTQNLAGAAEAAQRDREMRGQSYIDPGDPEGISQQQKAQEAQQATRTKEAQADVPENGEDPEAKQKRIAELEEKIDNKQASPDELKELRALKQNPEQRQHELSQKAKDGSISDDEIVELDNLNKSTENAATDTEKQMKEYEDRIATLFSETRDPNLSPAELAAKAAEMQEIADKANGVKRTAAEIQQDRDVAKKFLDPENAPSSRIAQKEKAMQKDIQEKLQLLMALERRLLTQKDRVDKLKDLKRNLANELRSMKTLALENMSQEERDKIYKKYLELNNVKAQIQVARHEGTLVDMQRRDTMQYVRRKLGVTHGLGAFIEAGNAKIANAVSEISMKADEHFGGDEDAGLLDYVNPAA